MLATAALRCDNVIPCSIQQRTRDLVMGTYSINRMGSRDGVEDSRRSAGLVGGDRGYLYSMVDGSRVMVQKVIQPYSLNRNKNKLTSKLAISVTDISRFWRGFFLWCW